MHDVHRPRGARTVTVVQVDATWTDANEVRGENTVEKHVRRASEMPWIRSMVRSACGDRQRPRGGGRGRSRVGITPRYGADVHRTASVIFFSIGEAEARCM